MTESQSKFVDPQNMPDNSGGALATIDPFGRDGITAPRPRTLEAKKETRERALQAQGVCFPKTPPKDKSLFRAMISLAGGDDVPPRRREQQRPKGEPQNRKYSRVDGSDARARLEHLRLERIVGLVPRARPSR